MLPRIKGNWTIRPSISVLTALSVFHAHDTTFNLVHAKTHTPPLSLLLKPGSELMEIWEFSDGRIRASLVTVAI